MDSAIASATDPSSSTGLDPWEPRTAHTNGHPPDLNGHASPHGHLNGSNSSPGPPPSPPPNLDPARSPASLALRAQLLGLTLGLSSLTTIYLTLHHASPLWRLPLFLSTLSLFHSLEYYTTALYNPNAATTSAFLLNNGRAYNVAHLCASVEGLVHWQCFPDLQILPYSLQTPWLVLGFFLLVLGQAVRTMAMAHAGSNFNHLVQSRKKAGHVLVTDGVYARLRHPSYFGFFCCALEIFRKEDRE
ncbi:MAG: hypothetical protein Q9217_000653 [Psora testacea]